MLFIIDKVRQGGHKGKVHKTFRLVQDKTYINIDRYLFYIHYYNEKNIAFYPILNLITE